MDETEPFSTEESTANAPHQAGDLAPTALTPEQLRTREAAFIYASRIAQGMEGFLKGPSYYANCSWESKLKQPIGVCELTAIEDERILTVHTPPDKYTEHNSEFSFHTKLVQLRAPDIELHPMHSGDEETGQRPSVYPTAFDENSRIFAQHGPRAFGGAEVLLEPEDLRVFDAILEEMFQYVPEVINSTRTKVAAVMHPGEDQIAG